MAEPTLRSLVDDLAGRGERPAIIALAAADGGGGGGRQEWSYAELHRAATRLGAGLLAAGVGRGEPVALLAPNRPEWAVACLAVLAAGAVVMPLSEQASREELRRAMADSGCRRVLTTRAHLMSVAELDGASDLMVVLLDADDAADGGDAGDAGDADGGRGGGLHARGWRDLLAGRAEEDGLPGDIGPDDPAALLYTSGTTGAPKGVLLSHANIACNIRGLIAEPLAGPDDRILMPLPLHHAYPLTVGLLAPFAVGAAVVMPAGITGPQVVRALNETRATLIVGVPRLYVGLMEGVEARVAGQSRLARMAFRRLLDASIWLRRRTGRRIGRALFRPLHRRLGPELRLLASGGARLDPELAWKLEGLGYEVLTGYGLTETSPILTFNPPGGRARLDTAGLPVPGVELRTEPVEDAPEGHGEIQARGPSVFKGYRNNPEATAEAFAEGGWFRTGDLGFIDPDGHLHITGRAKELIVLAGGENIYPEDVEAIYGQSPLVREVAVLEHDGRLVALVVPEEKAVRERAGANQPRELFREEIGRLSQRVPSHARVGDFALTRQPLPRTQIGKLRRHELPEIYRQEKSGEGRPAPAAARTAEDDALLASHPAGEVFAWLRERHPDRPLTLDSSPQFDLGLDSFAWMSLTVEVEERFGARLTDEQIAEVMTLRDLLRAVNEAAGRPAGGEEGEEVERVVELTPEQERWLSPPGPVATLVQLVLYGLNRAVMRGAFRLRVEGLERLPDDGSAFLLTPNHASYLDPFAVAAALPWRRLRRTWWAGWSGLLFRGPLTRAFSRITQVVPVDAERGLSSTLAYGRAALARDRALAWFPEGGRSADGELQRFLPGVGLLMDRTGAPAVPVWIGGTHEALPPGRAWPRLRPLTVTFGRPVTARELVPAGGDGDREQSEARIAERLRDRVAALGGEHARIAPSPPGGASDG